MGMRTKKDESSTGRMWYAGFQRVTARSLLVGVMKLMIHLFLQISNFFEPQQTADN
jgi:hypothetical protein